MTYQHCTLYSCFILKKDLSNHRKTCLFDVQQLLEMYFRHIVAHVNRYNRHINVVISYFLKKIYLTTSKWPKNTEMNLLIILI